MMVTRSTFTAKPGDVVEFRGCTWDEPAWEFDRPSVLYAPVGRYSPVHDIADMVEDVCSDLSIKGRTLRPFHPSDVSEFRWRGWSVRGFARRKRARHVTYRVRFYLEEGELAWDSEEQP